VSGTVLRGQVRYGRTIDIAEGPSFSATLLLTTKPSVARCYGQAQMQRAFHRPSLYGGRRPLEEHDIPSFELEPKHLKSTHGSLSAWPIGPARVLPAGAVRLILLHLDYSRSDTSAQSLYALEKGGFFPPRAKAPSIFHMPPKLLNKAALRTLLRKLLTSEDCP
jgi:hypothetical protein